MRDQQGVEWLPQVGLPQPTAAGVGLVGEVGMLGLPSPGKPYSGSLQTDPLAQPQQQGQQEGRAGTVLQQLLTSGTEPPPTAPLAVSPAEPPPAVPSQLGAAAALALAPPAPFAALSEAERLTAMQQIRKRQEDWLLQQRRGAALLVPAGSDQ